PWPGSPPRAGTRSPARASSSAPRSRRRRGPRRWQRRRGRRSSAASPCTRRRSPRARTRAVICSCQHPLSRPAGRPGVLELGPRPRPLTSNNPPKEERKSTLTHSSLSPVPLALDRKDTALVVIAPQNDVLSENGVSWPLVSDSVKENNTIENLARLFTAAKRADFGVFISPHYLYPHDQAWRYGGAAGMMMPSRQEVLRPRPRALEGCPGP